MDLAVLNTIADEYEDKYCDNPNGWIRDILGVELWSIQQAIVDSVFQNNKTAVRSCHSAGKTFVSACIVLAFMFLRYPCKIVTTAPTWYQVRDLLWSEINSIFKRTLIDMIPQAKPLQTRLEMSDDWFATGISPKESVNFQGFHQKNMLIVFDEAPGVRPEIVDGADSLMASGNAHSLWIGNPTESSGFFYSAFSDSSVNKIAISAYDTPNFTNEKISKSVAISLISQQWVEDKKARWGEDSPMFISRVLGDFPSESENQIISLALCEKAKEAEVAPGGDYELGVDVARFGDDKTVYTIKQGNIIKEQIIESKKDTMQVVGHIQILHREYNFSSIKVDDIGVGAGVTDRANELNLPVIGINSAEKPLDDTYFNKRSEMWYVLRDWLKTGKIPDDDDLVADLIAPHYIFTSNGKLRVEDKAEIKKRLKRSPDQGDSIALAIYSGNANIPKVMGWL